MKRGPPLEISVTSCFGFKTSWMVWRPACSSERARQGRRVSPLRLQLHSFHFAPCVCVCVSVGGNQKPCGEKGPRNQQRVHQTAASPLTRSDSTDRCRALARLRGLTRQTAACAHANLTLTPCSCDLLLLNRMKNAFGYHSCGLALMCGVIKHSQEGLICEAYDTGPTCTRTCKKNKKLRPH